MSSRRDGPYDGSCSSGAFGQPSLNDFLAEGPVE